MPELSWLQIGLLFGLVVAGAMLQGVVGYGMALIVSPAALLLAPPLIPGPLTLAAAALVGLIIVRDRQALDFLSLRWALLGLVGGSALGAFLLSRVSQREFALLFGGLILLAVGLSVIGVRFPPRRPILLGAGFLAGLMGLLTTISGPPIALVYQDAPGKQLRATISGFFVAGIVVTLVSLATIGRFGLAEIGWGLALVPPVLLGFWLSGRAARWVDRGYTRPAVLAVAAVSALTVLFSQLG